MANDTTFITNEQDQTLAKRFSSLIKDTKNFDCLVGYFYISGFYLIYKSFEKTEKIRILIGISTNKRTYDLIQESKTPQQTHCNKEIKDYISTQIIEEMKKSKDNFEVETGARKFVEWLRSKKLEIRVYPNDNIHAKVYIMSFNKNDRDKGRVITGSSNFSQAGLRNNLEFNVELSRSEDHKFALNKFNSLWEDARDVSEEYIKTIKNETWLNDEITPHQLYLKFLYEFFKEKINLDQNELLNNYAHTNFMELEYQKDAVLDAKEKLDEFGGVFISDVVGLGKTYISALLTKQLEGKTLVIAPPILLDKATPGSWYNVFSEFGIRIREANFESIGKLDKIIENDPNKYKNIIIDESHRFRNNNTQMYEKLFQICRGKRVILVSATPLNNTPSDILSQVELFQNSHKSTLPNPKVKDLEKYFKKLQNKLKGLDRQKNKEEYLKIVQENADDIKKNVLQYLMVRRTRTTIEKYYSEDLKRQKLKFPEIEDPKPLVYHFDKKLDRIFTETMDLIINRFKYSRYTPLLYLKEELTENKKTPQKNMGGFMKILLVKRLESSFFAFKQSISRFINSYKMFIETFEKGKVYLSKKHNNKIFDLLGNDDFESIQRLIESDKAEEYSSNDFNSYLIRDLKADYKLLQEVEDLWKDVDKDPKLDKLIEILNEDDILKKNKIILFTESKETTDYLKEKLNPLFNNKVLAFSSKSLESDRIEVFKNYDANCSETDQKNSIKILLTTDILAEGVSLNRSNIVINYDIPWNPVKMMQRVGRINRVSKNLKFHKIYTYNFFPAGPIDENISLKAAAESKIAAFIEMLGNDSRLLTDEEIKPSELFKCINDKKMISGEDEQEDPELKYLKYLRDLRDNNKQLFDKIKGLPKKSRSAKKHLKNYNSVVTFFKKGKVKKMFVNNGDSIEEIDFLKTEILLHSDKSIKREKLGPDFYEHLEKNNKEFDTVMNQEENELKGTAGNNPETKLKKILMSIQKFPEFTEEDGKYLNDVLQLIKKGAIAKATIKQLLNSIKKESNPLKILVIVKKVIPRDYFQGTVINSSVNTPAPKEVILSEYLVGEKSG